MKALLLALFCAGPAAAAYSEDPVEASIERWQEEAEKFAKKWMKDACAVRASLTFEPGRKDEMEGRIAGGQRYEFSFFSEELPTVYYHFKSPLQTYEAGYVYALDKQLEQGPGPVLNSTRCLRPAPIPLKRALDVAKKAGFQLEADLRYSFTRFHGDPLSVTDSEPRGAAVRRRGGREMWIFRSFVGPQMLSLVVVDSRSGRLLRRSLKSR